MGLKISGVSMAKKISYPEAQSPLILRASRLIEAFAKSDDERDFYLDKVEGFILFVDLDKASENLKSLQEELETYSDRYFLIPKMSFYETKKLMESFVNEKVYDIDTKERLLDIIQSKEARENFLEFIYDQHTELDKWQQFYQERSRIRIIEWLRQNNFHFVFEEDLEVGRKNVEKLKENFFEKKAAKDVSNLRKVLQSKAKTYYSSEALNPRPKRGRPPKQAVKEELEPEVSADIYTTVPTQIRQFLFTPDINQVSAAAFSSKYDSEEDLLTKRGLMHHGSEGEHELKDINRKLASLRSISQKWMEQERLVPEEKTAPIKKEEDKDASLKKAKKSIVAKTQTSSKLSAEEPLRKTPSKTKAAVKKTPLAKKPPKKHIIPKETKTKKAVRKIIPRDPKKKK